MGAVVSQPLSALGAKPLCTTQHVILVAEDNLTIRAAVSALLQLEGYSVLSGADGQESLEISRGYSGRIDLCITDQEMPRLSGIDLCMWLSKERPGIKMLVMSGCEANEFMRPEAGLPFLAKPFDARTLKARVRDLLFDRPGCFAD